MSQKIFTRYEIIIIAILSFLQFTIVLDFVVLSPLGFIIMHDLDLTTKQFGMVVSAYAISAGVSGLLTAGFADKFDRKKLLLFFYSGFVFGTLLCGLANSYWFLLGARIVTGIFGGVIGSVSYAIITDLFQMEVRGRVMGFVQMAFAGSQVLGIPIGLYLANNWGWNTAFLMIVGASIVVGVFIALYLKPIDAHLKIKSERSPFLHLIKTISFPDYARAFASTTLLATGGFMLMPFGSNFAVFNLGINKESIPLLYFITGVFSMALGPFIGKLSDQIGKYKTFFIGSVLTIIIVNIYCGLSITPFWMVTVVSVIMFAGVSSRMISSSALLTAVPDPADRGAFMSINSSVQYIAGGIATYIAGSIVVQETDGKLRNYEMLGYVVTVAMIITLVMLYTIHRYVAKKQNLTADARRAA
ncbi:MAG TPA: MFS transporter [Ohtaekwangia sp.]